MHTRGRFAFQYGSLEARIKFPNTADGVWPAFWMLGNSFPATGWPKCGEIDIVEIGHKDAIKAGLQHRRINSALHFSNRDEEKESLVQWFDAPSDLHSDFHRYRLEWTPDKMSFLLDDEQFATWDIGDPQFSEYHQPFYIILNLAVGSWVSSYTALDTPEKITASMPSKMEVDWIRLTANEHTKVIRNKPLGVFVDDPNLQSFAYADGATEKDDLGDRGVLYLWNNLSPPEKPAEPVEGNACWSFDVESGDWFGMGVFLGKPRDLSIFTDGVLTFQIKTKATSSLKVGIESPDGGESWVFLGDDQGDLITESGNRKSRWWRVLGFSRRVRVRKVASRNSSIWIFVHDATSPSIFRTMLTGNPSNKKVRTRFRLLRKTSELVLV